MIQLTKVFHTLSYLKTQLHLLKILAVLRQSL